MRLIRERARWLREGVPMPHSEERMKPKPKRLELEHLATVRPVGPGNWSPDGRSVAFFWADTSGATHLWIADLTDTEPRRLTSKRVTLEMAEGTDRRDTMGGPQWSPDGTRLVYTAPGSAGHGPSLWTIGLDGRPAVELAVHQGEDRTPRWSPDGRMVAFVGCRDGRDEIMVVPSEGGVPLQLTCDRWDNTDSEWSPDGRWIAYISQRSDRDLFSNSICKVPAAGGQPKRLTHDDSANERSPRWSPDGRRLVFVSNRDGGDNLWVMDAEGGEPNRLSLGLNEKSDPRWSPDGRHIAYAEFVDCRVQVRVVPLEGGVPRTVAGGGTNTAPRWSPDGTKLLYHHAGADSPGDLWAKEIAADPSEPGTRLTDAAGTRLDGIEWSTPRVVGYASSDGLGIQAVLYPAVGAPERGPAILYVHGGPNAVNTDGWMPQLQLLAQRGYAVLAPNYRGSTGYGKAFMEANRGLDSGGDVDDWLAGRDYLRSLGEVDGGRIAIMGRSYGGYATLMILGLHPGLFRCGVAISALSNQFTYWEQTAMPWTRRLHHWLYGLPSEAPDFNKSRSPTTYADRFRDPVLAIHGEADTGVPVGEAHEMAGRLDELGRSHTLLLYAGEGHVFAGPEAIIDSNRHIEQFLAEHLSAPRPRAVSRTGAVR